VARSMKSWSVRLDDGGSERPPSDIISTSLDRRRLPDPEPLHIASDPGDLERYRLAQKKWEAGRTGRIGAAHLADKLAYFYRHGRSSAALLRLPSPIRSKSRTVPTDYGLRSDDCKCATHLGKQSADASQYQPVNRNKSTPLWISASQHIDLLP
jgi:hypothetical protein